MSTGLKMAGCLTALALCVVLIAPAARADIVYSWSGDCVERSYGIDIGEVRNLGCPSRVHGTLTVPSAFQEGTPYSWVDSAAPFRLFVFDAWAASRGHVLDLVPFGDAGDLAVYADGSAHWRMSNPATASGLLGNSMRYFAELTLSPSGETYSYYAITVDNVVLQRVP